MLNVMELTACSKHTDRQQQMTCHHRLSFCLSMNEQPCYGSLIQDNLGEPVRTQRRGLLEQPLDFYEPDVLPAT